MRASTSRYSRGRPLNWTSEHRQRQAGNGDHLPHEGEILVEIVEVGDQLQHPGVRLADGRRDGRQLATLRAVDRCQRARLGFMVDGPRRREAERSRLDGLLGELCHLPDLGIGRRLEGGGPLPHRGEPQRRVRDLRGDVDVTRLALEHAEILAEGFPLPAQALVQRRSRDVLDALHQLDEQLAVLGSNWRETNPAVAHHRRGHAMPRRWLHVAVPDRLAVVVGVDVDESGCDQRAISVDLPGPRAAHVPDLGDSPADDRDIGTEGLAPAAVGYHARPHYQVVLAHRKILSALSAGQPKPQFPGREDPSA